MANRFWVGSTGDWTDTAHWATSSGGAGGQTVPGSSDAVIVDGHASGLNGGTLTVNATVNVQSITLNAAAGTVNFGANNVTISSFFSNSGTGARTIDLGSGTWTITASGPGSIFDNTTQTNATSCVYSNAALVFTATTSSLRTFAGGTSLTYGSLTINSNSSKIGFIISGTNTFSSITIADGTVLYLPNSITTTVSGAVNITGTSSAPSGLMDVTPTSGVSTLSVGSASTCVWCGINAITKSGAGSITATNSLDLGRNTSVTITAPSVGGGVVGVIGG